MFLASPHGLADTEVDCGARRIGCVVGSWSKLSASFQYGRVAASLRVFIFSYGRVVDVDSIGIRTRVRECLGVVAKLPACAHRRF
jgi:hypothetical protein